MKVVLTLAFWSSAEPNCPDSVRDVRGEGYSQP